MKRESNNTTPSTLVESLWKMTFNQNDIKNHFTYFPEKSNFDINYNSDAEVFVFIKYTSTPETTTESYDDKETRQKTFITSPYWRCGWIIRVVLTVAAVVVTVELLTAQNTEGIFLQYYFVPRFGQYLTLSSRLRRTTPLLPVLKHVIHYFRKYFQNY